MSAIDVSEVNVAMRALRWHRVIKLLTDDVAVPRRVNAFRQAATRLLLIEQAVLLVPITIVCYISGMSASFTAIAGLLFLGTSAIFYHHDPLSLPTRMALAIGLLTDVLLLIYALSPFGSWQLDGGHMWIFAVWSHCLAMLCWRSLVVSGVLGIVHHFVMIYAAPGLVFPDDASLGRVLLHGGVVVMQLSALCAFIFLIFRMLWLAEGLETSLERSARVSQDLNQSKSQFLAMMSHELRTPLNAILGFSEAMRMGVYGPVGNKKYEQYLDDIHTSGEHLLSIINDILDLSKVEAGKFELSTSRLRPSDITESCMRLVEGVRYKYDIRLAQPDYGNIDYVEADERLLKQMLVNLLSNACKYTHPGGEIGISWGRVGNSVAINVKDSGIGMSPHEIEIALTPFGQADNVMVKRREGTGLGLPLVKALAEAHHGRLEIRSTPGKGSVVTILLPLWQPRNSLNSPAIIHL